MGARLIDEGIGEECCHRVGIFLQMGDHMLIVPHEDCVGHIVVVAAGHRQEVFDRGRAGIAVDLLLREIIRRAVAQAHLPLRYGKAHRSSGESLAHGEHPMGLVSRPVAEVLLV